MKKMSWVSLVMALFVVCGCQTAQTPRAAEQKIVPKENESALATQLDHNIDAAYGAWKDPTAEKIINEMLQRLASSDPGYGETKGAHVHLLSTSTPYIAPGFDNTIYVSRGTLSAVSYENELAFLLGTQLALLKEHATIRNLASLHGQDMERIS